MQIYINAIFNHFRALQAWAAGKDAKLTLDLKTFEVEVKFRGRYYAMHPMFQGRAGGRATHTTTLPQDLVGFGGWRPYQALRHPHSTDKRLFKTFLREAGVRTPASLNLVDAMDAPAFDYLLKAAIGSFGQQIAGPFRAGTSISADQGRGGPDRGGIFVEQFVQGAILKVWFWGGKAFFAHSHSYPRVSGDGVATIEQLLRTRLRRGGLEWESYPDRDIVMECLRFQRTGLSDVVPDGESRWIDYRYSQHYERTSGVTPQTDDALAALVSKSGDQVQQMGTALAGLLKQTFPAPVMISVDGLLDEEGNIWWLEMNTNSVVPPEAYAAMFEDLFSF